MQVVQCGDRCSKVALGMVQLLYVPGNLLDLKEEGDKLATVFIIIDGRCRMLSVCVCAYIPFVQTSLPCP